MRSANSSEGTRRGLPPHAPDRAGSGRAAPDRAGCEGGAQSTLNGATLNGATSFGSLAAMETRAARVLPRAVRDNLNGAAGAERTAQWNETDFDRLALVPRIFRDVRRRSVSTMLLGREAALPLALSPVAFASLFHPQGDVAAASASRKTGAPYCASLMSNASIEEMASVGGEGVWFELFSCGPQDFIAPLLDRIRAAGCDTLVIAGGLSAPGLRPRDAQNRFALGGAAARAAFLYHNLPDLVAHPRWLYNILMRTKRITLPNIAPPGETDASLDRRFDYLRREILAGATTWDDVRRLRDAWAGKLVVKGVMTPDDALEAAALGADAVIVSNYGGRQLDGVASSISALPAIADALAGRAAAILLDGGVRSGRDVVKAIALGADGCMVGRPWCRALASGGEPALVEMASIFRTEIDNAMALIGVSEIGDIDRRFCRLA